MIEIDPEQCSGCQACLEVCPCDVIRFKDEEHVAYPKFPMECWYCGACVKECSSYAIQMNFTWYLSNHEENECTNQKE